MNSATPKARAAPRTWRDELHLVRGPLAGFAAALVVAVAVAGAVVWMREQQDAAMAKASAVHKAASARYRGALTDQAEIGVYQPRYLALKAAGLVGEENRLAWIEAVKQSQARHHLPSVDYEIEPQQLLNGPLAPGDVALRGSRMKLQMGLLHEGDLFDLLDDLRQAGHYAVQDCKLKRIDAPPELPLAPHLQAECTIVWLTLTPGGTT
jgi:hypothetical protein